MPPTLTNWGYRLRAVDLQQGEKVIYQGHPSWRAILGFYLAGLLDDADRRRLMGVAGPLRAAAYEWSLITRRYLDLMTETAHGGRG